jgi:Ca2+-transporting ATPase
LTEPSTRETTGELGTNAATAATTTTAAAVAMGLNADVFEAWVTDRDLKSLDAAGGVDKVASFLGTNLENGLSDEEVKSETRKESFGVNEFEYPPPKTFAELCLIALGDVTVRILIVASVVSLAVGAGMKKHRDEYGYLEGIAIVLVVCVVVFLQAFIDYAKELKFRQLNSIKDNYQVKLIRGGKIIAVPAGEVLVGDIVELAAGDKVPADCLFVEGSKFKANEAAMTGEPIDIAKSREKDPWVLSGTSISEGSGKALVIAVGSRSQWGVILKTLIVEPSDTPLQERLNRLVLLIGNFGIGAAVLTFLASMIRWIVDSSKSGNWDGTLVLDFLINAVTIVVVAIPEGLPLAITLGLAFAMRKMMSDQNLVRRLEACETMGSATQLNADKTGTLTQNRMTVTECWLAGKIYEEMPPSGLNPTFSEMLCQSMACNSDANLSKKENGTIEHLGSKTECALLQLVEQLQPPTGDEQSYIGLRKKFPVGQLYHFTSARKRMSTAIANGSGSRLHVKGASEIVVKLCTKVMGLDGKISQLTTQTFKEAESAIETFARRGLRTLCIAYTDLSKAPQSLGEEAPEKDLILLGIMGIKDPIRPETAEAVKLLRGAGVTVRMVTGDNAITAEAIAREAGILVDGEDGLVLEGPVFRKMSDAEKESVAMRIRVLARSSPSDKLVLCNLQRKLGEVVAVTGDGTNDAPALKDADVGFALGIAGTEIAKEACDIVILDDNIKSMAKAVLWGRNVYQSIRKFLQFQLVVNVVAVSLNLIAAIAGIKELPLAAVPLLWVNMIMDSMGALALATEPPSQHLMERKPFGRTAPLINKAMWRNIIGVSIYQLAVCMVFMFAGKDLLDIKCAADDEGCHHQTLELNGFIFNTFVFMQVFSEINSRRIKDVNVFEAIHKSPIFCGIIALTIGVQVLFIEAVGSTVVGPAIGFVAQSRKEWLITVIIGLVILPVGAFVRMLPIAWFPGETDEESNAKALEAARKQVAEAQAKAEAERKEVSVQMPTSPVRSGARGSMDRGKQALSHIGESIVSSRLQARQSRLSDSSTDVASQRGEKSFRVFAHAVIAANRLSVGTTK